MLTSNIVGLLLTLLGVFVFFSLENFFDLDHPVVAFIFCMAGSVCFMGAIAFFLAML